MSYYWEELAKSLDNYNRETFNKVGELLCARHPKRFENIFLDIFHKDGNDYAFIVVVFFGGSMSVRNACMNSLTANIRELGKLLYGGYYDEVKNYQALKSEDEEGGK